MSVNNFFLRKQSRLIIPNIFYQQQVCKILASDRDRRRFTLTSDSHRVRSIWPKIASRTMSRGQNMSCIYIPVIKLLGSRVIWFW